jgi:signal transduction histidine kinase/CheY-like chemotaxis protein
MARAEHPAESRSPDSGIAAAGAVAWGTHFCVFYRTRDELRDTLAAYFRAGLEAGEACVLFTSGPDESLPGFGSELEVVDTSAGRFESVVVLNGWMDRFRSALSEGRAGLRIAGNTAWLQQAGWPRFMEHERKVKEMFGRSRFLCLCAYCLEDRNAQDVFDVARVHDFAVSGPQVVQSSPVRLVREDSMAADLALLQRRLDEKTQDLDAALNAREEFLSLLGHELRNPLGPLRNAARIVRMAAAPDPTITQATDIIERHVSQLSRLVDDLLDLGRLTRGTMSLLKDDVQLDSVIATALQLARPLIEFRGQELVISLPSDSLYLNADPVRLAQVFANMLDNAAVYTPKGGKIWVSAEYEDGSAVVRIRDNGVGIPPHLLSRIFALFVQGQRRQDRTEGGLGIGLSLVKRLVELHGGTVQALSEGEGRGSEFIVRLPVTSRQRRAESAHAGIPDEGSRPKLRVLVVDDHQDSNEMLAQLLTLNGHEVRRVGSGPAAIEAGKEFGPDAVLLDIGLPGMDGYEVARNLRQLDATRGSVLIAVTGYGSSRDMRESSQAGIDHHLVKPVEPDRLFAILESIVPAAARDSGDGKVLSFGARLRRAASVLVRK